MPMVRPYFPTFGVGERGNAVFTLGDKSRYNTPFVGDRIGGERELGHRLSIGVGTARNPTL